MSKADWIPVWSCGLASFGQVSVNVDVESVKTWLKSGDVSANLAFLALCLSKLHKSVDT